ncbi:hypothetical protein CP985_03335 [Malaciobacter mytili LMG 24559]|uniref:Uncharacterized protein n=1 Tax=Malaciobacter mytili LMG 24559 TaxID=1032238 RepID=A0AAX2AHI3_9BACT|nr:hypothetical protein [Malaciobacter mytili]AXH16391.1 putative membrane protein [Malaciobacter mytili LMG 24559]RXK16457.1 hypothetical protein CP985_03335 [Malaciobacter mytili LMG 24559]
MIYEYLNSILTYYLELDTYLLKIMNGSEFYVYILLTILVMSIKAKSNQSMYVTSFVYLIGTFFHELAHYIAAIILILKKPKGFTIIPKRVVIDKKKYYCLGSVDINNEDLNWFNSALIAMAPLVLLILSYYVYLYFYTYYLIYFKMYFFTHLIYIFLLVTLVVNSIPSITDFKLSLKGGSLIIWTIFICGVIYLIIKI